MKKFRLTALALVGVVLPTGILVACGDDDAILLAQPPSEAGADARTDGAARADGNSTNDSATSREDAGQDAANDADAGDEPDADAGAEPDADSGIPVGEPDSGVAAKAFQVRVTEEICRYTARCCFGDADLDGGAPVDGGTWQQAKCMSTYGNSGFENSNPGAGSNPDHLTFNKAAGDACLSLLQTTPCNQTSAEFKALRKACYDATVGTQKTGEPCGTTPECQPGNFCNTTLDGGAGSGVCEAVRPTDAKCGDWTSNAGVGQSTCSYRLSGDPARYCDFYDVAGGAQRPTNEWTCRAALADGERCANGAWCQSGLCELPGRVCAPTKNPYSAAACTYFATP